MSQRLDLFLVENGLVQSRSQAQNLIKLGKVKVNGEIVKDNNFKAGDRVQVEILEARQYVSRAAYKLHSVVEKFGVDFYDSVVLDVGSSTGGFTDYVTRHGAKKVVAVDVGTDQLHPTLRGADNIELHEKTDIRDFKSEENFDYILIDVSFISLKKILPAISELANEDTAVVAMLKPQFEAGEKQKNKGVIKNDTIRRQILKDFEAWSKANWFIEAKADSEVEGNKGNVERFYKLKKLKR